MARSSSASKDSLREGEDEDEEKGITILDDTEEEGGDRGIIYEIDATIIEDIEETSCTHAAGLARGGAGGRMDFHQSTNAIDDNFSSVDNEHDLDVISIATMDLCKDLNNEEEGCKGVVTTGMYATLSSLIGTAITAKILLGIVITTSIIAISVGSGIVLSGRSKEQPPPPPSLGNFNTTNNSSSNNHANATTFNATVAILAQGGGGGTTSSSSPPEVVQDWEDQSSSYPTSGMLPTMVPTIIDSSSVTPTGSASPSPTESPSTDDDEQSTTAATTGAIELGFCGHEVLETTKRRITIPDFNEFMVALVPLETLFVTAYNSMSYHCNDMYERHIPIYGVSLIGYGPTTFVND